MAEELALQRTPIVAPTVAEEEDEDPLLEIAPGYMEVSASNLASSTHASAHAGMHACFLPLSLPLSLSIMTNANTHTIPPGA